MICIVKAPDIIQNSPDTSKLPDSLSFPYKFIINPFFLLFSEVISILKDEAPISYIAGSKPN